MRRISVILALVLGTTLAFPLVARADYATFFPDEQSLQLSPGDIAYGFIPLVIVASDDATLGMIVYEGTSGFADDETVVATIALSLHQIDGLGSVELLSSPTITGTTPVDWTTGGDSWYFELGPPIEFRYSAPSAEELGCDDYPGEDFATYVHVDGTLVGSKGTIASLGAENRHYVFDYHVTCPMAAPTSRPGAPAAPATPACGVVVVVGGDWRNWSVLMAAAYPVFL